MNLFMEISGGASTQLIERDLRDALADSGVSRIILYIDSPGGTVDGTFELANFIYESRGKKPLIAFTDGMMTSAAYAIGSAADAIFISGDTVIVGNIGVVTAHEDISVMQEKMGIKTTEIYSGKYKRIASEYAPLSDEGRQAIQDRIDYFYTAFINMVARNRGVSPETVLNTMSTDVKDMHIGMQAIEAGLVDGVSTIDRLINRDPEEPLIISGKYRDSVAGGASAETEKTMKEEVMTLAELKEKHPELYAAARQEGADAAKTAQDEATAAARKEGAAAETARVKAVREQLIPGHEALIEALMFDGAITGEQAAVKVLAAEKQLRSGMKQKLIDDAAELPTVPAADAAAAPKAKTSVDDERPVEIVAKEQWDASKELRAEFGGDFDRYLHYVIADSEKKFKVLTK